MRLVPILAVVALFAAVGCQTPVQMIPDPVDVGGKVIYADGKPVKNVTLELQPTGVGLPTTMKVGPDGAAKGKLIPGNYVFFFSASKGGTATVLKSIPAKYHVADKDNTHSFSEGQDFAIQLDAN